MTSSHIEQSVIEVDTSECVIVYVKDQIDKQVQTENALTSEANEHNKVETKDAFTQTTNSYFFLQVYDEGGEMKLAFNSTSAFNEILS